MCAGCSHRALTSPWAVGSARCARRAFWHPTRFCTTAGLRGAEKRLRRRLLPVLDWANLSSGQSESLLSPPRDVPFPCLTTGRMHTDATARSVLQRATQGTFLSSKHRFAVCRRATRHCPRSWPRSYKKDVARECEDHTDPDWVSKTYLVDFKQQWRVALRLLRRHAVHYHAAGGWVGTRVPCFPGRHLIHSMGSSSKKDDGLETRVLL